MTIVRGAVLLIVIAVGGWFVGKGLSQWSARLHPPVGWDGWYVADRNGAQARRELIPNEPGVLRVAARSYRPTFWDVSLSKPAVELQASTPYRLRISVRSRYAHPVLLSMTENTPPFLSRGLLRSFTPTADWQDLTFDFRTTPGSAGTSLAFLLGAPEVEVDFKNFDLAERSPTANHDEPLPETGWTMLPLVRGGKLTYPDQSAGEVVFERSTGEPNGLTLAYAFADPPPSQDLVIALKARSEPPLAVTPKLEWTEPGGARSIPLPPFDIKTTSEEHLIPVHIENPEAPQMLVLGTRGEPCVIAVEYLRWEKQQVVREGGLVDLRWLALISKNNQGTLVPASQADGTLRLEGLGKADPEDWSTRLELVIPSVGDQHYRLSFDAKADEPRPIRWTASQAEPPGPMLPETTTYHLAKDWSGHEFTFRAPAGCRAVRIGINASASEQSFEIRRVTLSPIEP